MIWAPQHIIVDIAISSNYAYLLTEDDDLMIVDISSPSSPKIVGMYSSEYTTRSVAVSGNYVYIASAATYGSIEIVDISTPSTPMLKAIYEERDQYAIIDSNDICVVGNYAYVLYSYWSSNGVLIWQWGGISIVDISNPYYPKNMGKYTMSYKDPLTSNRIVTGDPNSIAVSGKYAYLADSSRGLSILNITNPAAPTLTGFYGTSASYVAVVGNYAYVGVYNGLQLFDISNPAVPILVGSYYDPIFLMSTGIAVSGNYVYGSYIDEFGLMGTILGNVHATFRTDFGNMDADPVLAAIGNKTANVNSLLSFTVSATDPNGDKITYLATGLPTGATFDGPTGVFSWNPGTAGVYYVTFTATANGQSDSETVKITVTNNDWNPWNDPSSAEGNSITLSELQTAIYDWRFGVTLSNGETVDLTRLQGLIYSWRFG